MNVVLVMFKDEERREFPLTEEKTILGRRQDCHLRIPTRDVSRQHCELDVEDDALKARDLGSSNGTFVNGKRIAEATLKAGDQLRVGPVTFYVQIDGEPTEIVPAADTASSDVTPTSGGPGDDETFELSEDDFDLDDPISALEELEDDEDDMP